MLDGMSDSIQRSMIENLHSREVDRQSPTGLIFPVIFKNADLNASYNIVQYEKQGLLKSYAAMRGGGNYCYIAAATPTRVTAQSFKSSRAFYSLTIITTNR